MLKTTDIRRILCGPLQENAYLVCPEGRGDAFLVDPGDDANGLLRAVRESGRTLSAILLTHGHFDHMLGAQPVAEMTGATVYIHAGDEEMLDNPDFSCYNPSYCQLAPPAGLERTLYGDTLEVCGQTLKVLHTPGHSKGSVCLYEPDGCVMFTGDTLFCDGYGRTDLHGGNGAELVASLKMLLAMEGGIRVYPGHDCDSTIAAERGRYSL